MADAHVRFYAELNDLLPPRHRHCGFRHEFGPGTTVKDLIEGLGVPHTEVDLVLVDGEPVDFARRLSNGERLSVYPVFESLDIGGVTKVRPEPLRDPRFVLDVHLGRLAGYLRLLGFDTLYRNDSSDDELVTLSVGEQRILLTRDRGLLKHATVTHGYLVKERAPRRQLQEVIRRFDLSGRVRAFTRCMRCNGMLEPVAKKDVASQVPPRSAAHHADFRLCAGCGHVYWQGSHYRALLDLVATLQEE